jgi:hypothetical protein
MWLGFYLPIIILEETKLRQTKLPPRSTPFGWRIAIRSERRTYHSILGFLVVSFLMGALSTDPGSTRT